MTRPNVVSQDAQAVAQQAREQAQQAREIAQQARDQARAQVEAARAQVEAARALGEAGVQVNVTPDGKVTRIEDAATGEETVITQHRDGSVTVNTNGSEQKFGPGPWTNVIDRLTQHAEHPSPTAFFPPPDQGKAIPDGIVPLIGIIFGLVATTIIGLPIARAYARRMDRKGAPPAAAPAPEMASRLDRIEQAIETMAVEMERVSEAQRYSARLLTERLPEPARAIAGMHADQR